MNLWQIGFVAAAVAAGAAAFLGAWRLAWHARRRRAAASGRDLDQTGPDHMGPEPRLALIERAQAEFATRLDALADHAPEERLQAMAGSLAHLIRDKNATLETALAGLDSLRARLRALEQMGDLAEARGLFEKLGARLDDLQAGTEIRLAGLAARAEAGRGDAGLAEQLTRLHAQKDAALEAVLARVTPLEVRLATAESRLDGPAAPGAAIERLAADLAELRLRTGAAEGREEGARAALAERLETLQGRLDALETPGEHPFAEVSGQLTRLYAQKDATVETVFSRLAPLETRLGEVEAGLAPLAARVTALANDGGAAAQPFAEIADQLTRLYAQKDRGTEAALERFAPLEARLAALEARPWDPDEHEARAEAQAIAAQLIAARAAAEQTELFANRLTLLEASLPRLGQARALMTAALERRAAARGAAAPAAAPEAKPAGAMPAAADVEAAAEPAVPEVVSEAPPESGPESGPERDPEAADRDAIWRLPRVVSLHHG